MDARGKRNDTKKQMNIFTTICLRLIAMSVLVKMKLNL